MYSINHLKKKNDIITDLTMQQRKYNEAADDILKKQKRKIKELETSNNDYANNCNSMEFLIKHMGLEHLIMKLANKNSSGNLIEKDSDVVNERENEKVKEEGMKDEKVMESYNDGNVDESEVVDQNNN